MNISFVAIRFDYANQDKASACAIGLVKVENGQPTSVLYEKFLPKSENLDFFDDASQTGGLRSKDIQGLNDFSTLWPTIEAFIGDLPLVANSARTYMQTLEILWSEAEVNASALPYLCTEVLGRKITELASFSLNFYAHEFGYELPEIANALDKAKATAAIMLGLASLSKSDSLVELTESNDVQFGSVSSKERIACKSTRSYDYSVSKSDLQTMRQEFEAAGFDENHPLFEKRVLITGTLRKGTGPEIDKLLAKVGAFPELNFTKKTDYLVVGYDRIEGLAPGGKPTSKIKDAMAARAKGQLVEILDEEAFVNLLED